MAEQAQEKPLRIIGHSLGGKVALRGSQARLGGCVRPVVPGLDARLVSVLVRRDAHAERTGRAADPGDDRGHRAAAGVPGGAVRDSGLGRDSR